MSKFIHLIADYGKCDPAFSEVVHKFKSIEPSIEVQTTPVPSFSTVATGFWIAQHGLHSPTFEGLGIYANTAPRKHDDESCIENEGRELVYAKLENGVPVVAVNSGHSLSFVKDNIEELRKVETKNRGSQFRSRDYYPEAVAGIMNDDSNYIGEELEKSIIPDLPEETVGYIDGYGNIKTTVRASEVDLEPGTELEITIDGETRKAFYENGTFEVPEGELSFAPGSSGGEDPFIEIFLRGGSAADTFNNPEIGEKIEIKTA